MNPFTDSLRPDEERIVDLTLKHLRSTVSQRLDALCAAVVHKVGREVTKEEFEQHVCRVYLQVYRKALSLGRRLTWKQIHARLGRPVHSQRVS